MKRIMVAAALIACFFATAGCETLLGPSEAEAPLPGNPPRSYDMVIEGAPDMNFINVKGGYYIWSVGNSWHVRVARTDTQLRSFPMDFFTGTIRVEGGHITNAETRNVLPPDDMRADPNSILYRFEVQQGVKGVDFMVRPVTPEYCITFDPRVNDSADPGYVHLGNAMVVPDTVPIKICFMP